MTPKEFHHLMWALLWAVWGVVGTVIIAGGALTAGNALGLF